MRCWRRASARRAMGQATTVHPLLANFDRLGWLGGAWASRRDRSRVRAVVASRAPKASYAWTIFKPDRDALAALAEGVRAAKAGAADRHCHALRQAPSPRSTMCRPANPAARSCCRERPLSK